jgi:hypothetical protein
MIAAKAPLLHRMRKFRIIRCFVVYCVPDRANGCGGKADRVLIKPSGAPHSGSVGRLVTESKRLKASELIGSADHAWIVAKDVKKEW